ncbi:MAG: UbiX family flavin prenyltransferase [Omnitrophica WOR_2 bacterium]
MNKRVILAITGASGAILGIRALQLLKEAGVETHLVVSLDGRSTIALETDWKIEEVFSLADVVYEPQDTGAAIASGSFVTHGMLVVPCSVKTLSAIASSFTHNLVVRAADVCLKEGRPLVLAVRETPLHAGHLRLMTQAARSGAVIFPPIPAFYGKPQTVEDITTSTVARMLLRLGIDTPHYFHWEGKKPDASQGG